MATLDRPDTIYYELAGASGPNVILIQGIGVTGDAWRRQVDVLSRFCRTLLFDNRGIGRSVPCVGPISINAMAEDVRALMDELGWESAHVVGHSMGGLIGQQVAIDAPGRVLSLSCICSFSRGIQAARLTLPVLWMGIRTRVGSRRMRRNAFVKILYSADRLRAAHLPDLASETSSMIGRDLADSPPILMKQLSACAGHDLHSSLGELANIPTLVVSAKFDTIALQEYGRDLAAAIPGAQFLLHAGAAHGNLLEQPAWLNERLLHHFVAANDTGLIYPSPKSYDKPPQKPKHGY